MDDWLIGRWGADGGSELGEVIEGGRMVNDKVDKGMVEWWVNSRDDG